MKRFFQNFYVNLFLTGRLFAALGTVSVLYLLAFFFPAIDFLPTIGLYALLLLLAIDVFLLYRQREGIYAHRRTPERLSNGDDNEISIYIESRYRFPVQVGIIDEVPVQFQRRDIGFQTRLPIGGSKILAYQLRPVKRGEYAFGRIRLYVKSPLTLIERRFTAGNPEIVPVYPSFTQLRKYELMAVSQRVSDYGSKRIRRVGHSMEFDQIKQYVPGDDYRTLNWKATARQGQLMVNAYTDERSQSIYCVLDKSRAMRMPFHALSLLDYAINASLALSKVVMLKEDKAGLITISDRKGAVIPADRKAGQLGRIMEVLYKEKTRYLETNMELLYTTIRQTAKQRSLLVFFTNFESMSGMKRQLPILKRIAKFHALVVVFFENTELTRLTNKPAADVEEIYLHTIASKFAYEKKQIVRELNLHGIQAVLTPPEDLTVHTINKYLAIKARQYL
ncbi:hypothetical protein GCM10011386_33020 [Parapedobacter defluvii]|uniref:DUF58 domain-containing protein n=1 Tax=Parapedobacter defluvii TaxID=2045106 RepID=A0ABQ1MEC2_9SPHI|nr:DUF58 domain-containing protein [Parapedobacter defluvii]GGC38313.1 hypothetical protein GCM10011386_33020 [Parapedobacter defluvii]